MKSKEEKVEQHCEEKRESRLKKEGWVSKTLLMLKQIMGKIPNICLWVLPILLSLVWMSYALFFFGWFHGAANSREYYTDLHNKTFIVIQKLEKEISVGQGDVSHLILLREALIEKFIRDPNNLLLFEELDEEIRVSFGYIPIGFGSFSFPVILFFLNTECEWKWVWTETTFKNGIDGFVLMRVEDPRGKFRLSGDCVVNDTSHESK